MINFSATVKDYSNADRTPPKPRHPHDLEPVRAALAEYDHALTALVEAAEGTIIEDDKDQAGAAELLAQINKMTKTLDARRKEIISDADGFVRAVNGLARSFKSKADKALSLLKGKMGAYAQAKELERRKREAETRAAQEEAQKKLDAEAKKAKVKPVKLPDPVEVPRETKIATEAGTVYERKTWKFKVRDETQVPREYLMVDERAIRAAIKDGIRKIPGVEIFEHVEVATRR